MNNEKLEELSFKVDDIIVELSKEYDIDPLSVVAIFNARMYATCQTIGIVEDFSKLLQSIIDRQKIEMLSANAVH
jgi:hypothetical protein